MRVPDLSVFELTGKKALVTGGGSGIGKAGAIGFAKAGADVAIADVNFEAAKKVAKQIKDSTGQNSFPIKVDVTKVNQVRKMVDEVVSKFGRLDIAFNNAGVSGGSVPIEKDESLEDWKRVIEVNLNSVFYCCQAEAKIMIKQKGGKIINTA